MKETEAVKAETGGRGMALESYHFLFILKGCLPNNRLALGSPSELVIRTFSCFYKISAGTMEDERKKVSIKH